MMRRFLALFFLCFFCLSSAAFAQNVRATQQDGFARLAVDFGQPVIHTAEIIGNELILSFDRPFLGDPYTIVRRLSGYLRSVVLSPDKYFLTFRLNRQIALRSFTVENAIIVDMLDNPDLLASQPSTTLGYSEKTGIPRPVVGKMAAETESLPFVQQKPPLIAVRSARHEGYRRFVFDWPAAVPFHLTQKDSVAKLTFKAPGRLALQPVRSQLPKAMQGLFQNPVKDGVSVSIPVTEGQDAQAFALGNRIVLDIRKTEKAAPVSVSVDDGKNAPPPPKALPVKTVEAVPLPAIKPTLAAKGRPTASADTILADVEEGDALSDMTAPEDPVAIEEPISAATPTDTASLDAETERASDPTPQEEAAYLDPGRHRRVLSLSFPWERSTAAAVFQRGGYLWVVFDQYDAIDIEGIINADPEIVFEAFQLPHSISTVLRLLINPEYAPSVRREGTLWIVDLAKKPYRPQHSLEIRPEAVSEIGPRLSVVVPEAAPVIPIVDPSIGDVMRVVPALPVGYGVYPAYELTDFTLPVTVQGLALIAHNEAVAMRTSRQGVQIYSKDENLALSRDIEHLADLAALGSTEKLQTLFDVRNWARGGEETYAQEERRLMQIVTGVADERRNEARFELARFYFAHGRSAESQGILDLIREQDPAFASMPSFNVLEGLNAYLSGYNEKAETLLSDPRLASSDELSFWRAAIKTRKGDAGAQAAVLTETSGFLRTYPRYLRTQLALVALDSVLKAEDDLSSQNFLELAKDHGTNRHFQAAVNYYEAIWNDLTGNYRAAMRDLSLVEDMPSRYYRVLATRDRILMELKAGLIHWRDAAEQLERLRYAWRGGDFEFSIMEELGRIHADGQNYAQSLRTMKDILIAFPTHPRVEEIPARMQALFEKLYLDGLADEISPISAIALYNEFRELTPPGEKGETMIQKLADRMVSVDLLEEASKLLDRQVTYRLEGEEKSRIGARLSLVHLLNRQPEQALASLAKSRVDTVPEGLIQQRRHLEARALMDLKRGVEGIDILTGDMSRRAQMLRAEIYWSDQKWGEAAKTLRPLVRVPQKGEPRMNDEELQRLLDYTTALRLAGRHRAVTRLRYNFMKHVTDTPYYEAFNLLTSGGEDGVLTYQSVLDEVAQAERFKTFLSTYIDQLKLDGLSGIN